MKCPAIRAWCQCPKSPARQTITTSTSRVISIRQNPKIFMTRCTSMCGIPNHDWMHWELLSVFPSLRAELFESNGRTGYSQARVESQQLKGAILRYPEFAAYSKNVALCFTRAQVYEPMLKAIKAGVKPKP